MTYKTGFVLLVLLLCFSAGQPAIAEEPPPVTAITVVVGHRYHTQFKDVIEVEMHKRTYIGDTEFSFEIVGFYPDFAIVESDTTKEVTTLSDEPKNVAFKIVVYENDEVVDNTWSFYSIEVPHYARKSLIKFDVTQFTYRGKAFKKETKEEDKES